MNELLCRVYIFGKAIRTLPKIDADYFRGVVDYEKIKACGCNACNDFVEARNLSNKWFREKMRLVAVVRR